MVNLPKKLSGLSGESKLSRRMFRPKKSDQPGSLGLNRKLYRGRALTSTWTVHPEGKQYMGGRGELTLFLLLASFHQLHISLIASLKLQYSLLIYLDTRNNV